MTNKNSPGDEKALLLLGPGGCAAYGAMARGYGGKSRVQWMKSIAAHCCAHLPLECNAPKSGCPGISKS